jgi:hypothetical protein
MEFKLINDAHVWDSLVNVHCGKYKQYYHWNSLEAQYLSKNFVPVGIYENGIPVDIFPLILDSKKKWSFSYGSLQSHHLIPSLDYVWSAYCLKSIMLFSTSKISGIKHSVETVNYDLVTDISKTDTLDEFLKTHRFVRRNYQKALKNKITIKAEDTTDNFYGFYTAMIKRNRAKCVFPQSWFNDILAHMSGQAQIRTAFFEGRAIGSILFIKTSNSIFDYFPAIDYQFRHLQAGTLLTMEVFNEALNSRLSYINLGPDIKNSRTCIYKSNFGACMQPVYTYHVEESTIKRIQFRVINLVRNVVFSSPRLFSLIKRIVRT